MASHIERRKFLATLGAAATWPLAARVQQPAMPVFGFINLGTPDAMARYVAALPSAKQVMSRVKTDRSNTIG